MNIRWKLRMAAAQREVWTGTQLRRLLADKAGLELSAASVSALFCDEGGGRIHRGTIRNRLAYLLELEQAAAEQRGAEGQLARFSPHGLRHACATHNYERGVDLVAIQQLLGHWTVGSTMRYVRPSATFIEDAYRRAVAATLGELTGEEPTA